MAIKAVVTHKKPILFMLVGLPGAGKSVLANEIYVQRSAITKPIVCSSDALRKELYGDENSQEHNNEIFIELHRRIKDLLCNGKDVIYDATNISKRRRVQFLKELEHIECSKVCVALMTPYDTCKENDNKRPRVVGESVVRKMYLSWCPPDYNEGFDDIILSYHYSSDKSREKFTLKNFFGGEVNADNINQDNKHHTYTIGKHCRATADYIKEHYPNDDVLYNAGLLHDIGKVFTKSKFNAKGIKDGTISFIIDPNTESGTVCKIGAYWFYFGGLTAEEMNPDEYIAEVSIEDVVNEIFDVLEEFRTDARDTFKDEYDYYNTVLDERTKDI